MSVPIPLQPANLLGYLRFVLLLLAYSLAPSSPHSFALLFWASVALGALDGSLARLLKQESFYGAQLDILVSRFATTSLIFVVLKLGVTQIGDESERMSFSLFFGTLFLSDFVSAWFQVYSAYLLDEEPHKTPNAFLSFALGVLRIPMVNFAMCGLSELYVFTYYVSFFPKEFASVINHPQYNLIVWIAAAGILLKNIHNVIHLYVSSIRIVKLDVAQKNAQATPAKATVSSKPNSSKKKQ